MASLTEVRSALKQGDKQKAAQVLKVVLKEKPSADAWVLAAKMSSSPDTAKQHLQRALTFDSKHAIAREMLRNLGGEQKSYHRNLIEEVQLGMEEFGQNSRLLSRLPPTHRALLVGTVFVTVFIVTIILLSNLANPPRQEVPEYTPAPTAVVLASDLLLNHFSSSGLGITDVQKVDPMPETPVFEQIQMNVTDAVGTHPVTVYLYAGIDSLANDRLRLAELGASNKVIVHHTAVLVYPLEVDTSVGSSLESLFNAVGVS